MKNISGYVPQIFITVDCFNIIWTNKMLTFFTTIVITISEHKAEFFSGKKIYLRSLFSIIFLPILVVAWVLKMFLLSLWAQ